MNGRTATDMAMYCPGCGKRLAIPEGFKPPELLKCQVRNCNAQWTLIRGSNNWAARRKMKMKKFEKRRGNEAP